MLQSFVFFFAFNKQKRLGGTFQHLKSINAIKQYNNIINNYYTITDWK